LFATLAISAILSEEVTFKRLGHSILFMARKMYFSDELDPSWRTAWNAGKQESELRNHRGGTSRKIANAMLWVCLDFQDQGIQSIEDISPDNWLALVERYRMGLTRSKNVISEMSIKKRKEALMLMLKALKLHSIVDFVEKWKPGEDENIIRWWTNEEMEAMNQTAIKMFNEGDRIERAIAHFLHYTIGPRRSDSALFTWERIDLDEGMIRFPAHKNRKRCQTKIEPRLIPFFERYKDIVSKCKDGDVYLFPKSRAQKSGTDKKNNLHITDATIAKWLAYVRDKTSEEGNIEIRKFPCHSYRHSIAMRYLNSGCQYEDVAGVLGDTIATIEKHYSELIFTPAREAAWRKAHCFATKISSEGTAQPAFILRDGGFRTHSSNFRAASHSGLMDSSRVVDAGGSASMLKHENYWSQSHH
jgi:integrase